MSNLLETYEQLQKQAEYDELDKERVDVIVKYASLAEEKLSDAYGDNYTEDDVIKVAEFMIDNDLAVEEEQEKIAEYDQLGRIMARAYIDELSRIEAE
jgi:predicted ATP-dependent protease